jgi:hypothetical protein
MDPRTRRLFVAALGVIVLAAAFASYLGGEDRRGRPAGPTVDGVVVQVESGGLASVTAFTIRTLDGDLVRFGLAELRNAAAFPPAHLSEHIATAVPVRVWYREAEAGREALWLEDAPSP